ncbi:hypothetical protein MAR_019003, partial [Mya arenaria]
MVKFGPIHFKPAKYTEQTSCKMSTQSAQGKMRTNGMFLRSFDSKRYHELQTQKAKILEKQKELMKIKEKKEKKKKQGNGDNVGEVGDERAEADVENHVTVEDGAFGITMTLKEEVPESEMDMIVEKAGKETSNSKTSNANGIKSPSAKTSKSKESKGKGAGKSLKSVQPKVQSIYADLKAAKEEGKGNASSVVMNGMLNDNEAKSEVTSEQPVKEYAIIAKLNQKAIQRETELLDNESKTGVYAKVNPGEVTANGKELTESTETTRKTNTDAYAIVDLYETKSIVDEINGNVSNALDQTKDVHADKTTEEVVPKSTSTLSAKYLPGKPTVGNTGYREIVYNYRHGKMSLSAGYHGDMDTSTSSIEPDYMDIGQFGALLTNKLTTRDKLVITEEQLASLQTVTSSSSGFDDSSSISSGDISDTINEISTDEGNLQTGSNQDQNPYAAGKRAGPKDLFRNLTNANLHATPGKR